MRRPADYAGATYSAIDPDMTPAERNRTRNKTAAAIRRGELIRPNVCDHCHREQKVQAHHPSYRDHLNIMWLCRACHWAEHERVHQAAGFVASERAYVIARREATEENWRRDCARRFSDTSAA